ncbi:concanavalin A-like lectin protein kinase family protein [Striga asiatica]|uniref:Concanavalin A-like lectin protein kinase family protein n=1 Tax=Striga asiatica TaxID=4170 RepID=A0A5A7RJD5_STRAF|nr:concanavalin A-like lectin protein kinase family protein [Striga asiatica]
MKIKIALKIEQFDSGFCLSCLLDSYLDIFERALCRCRFEFVSRSKLSALPKDSKERTSEESERVVSILSESEVYLKTVCQKKAKVWKKDKIFSHNYLAIGSIASSSNHFVKVHPVDHMPVRNVPYSNLSIKRAAHEIVFVHWIELYATTHHSHCAQTFSNSFLFRDPIIEQSYPSKKIAVAARGRKPSPARSHNPVSSSPFSYCFSLSFFSRMASVLSPPAAAGGRKPSGESVSRQLSSPAHPLFWPTLPHTLAPPTRESTCPPLRSPSGARHG